MNVSGLYILIIDSEPSSVAYLSGLLETISLISSIESVGNSELALVKIINSSPDIIFMEYPLLGNAGNELIKFIRSKLVETVIVFVSDSKIHAATAIRSGIYNYLLKPFDQHDIKKVMDKVMAMRKSNNIVKLNLILDQIPEVTRLKVQTTKGYLLINPDELIYCLADGVYTELYLTNSRMDLSYLFLSKMEEILKPFNFMKVSRSCIINMKYLRRVFRDNNLIILSMDGKEYKVKGSKQSVRILSKIETE